MQPSDLFSATPPKAGKARRNSPRTPSAKALGVVRNLDAGGRMAAAKDIIALFADVGVDRKKLADYLGLSHSSTSHWHHGANSISAHNLAVLLDSLHEYLKPSWRAMVALNAGGRVAALMSAMGFRWTRDVGLEQQEAGGQGQSRGEPTAAKARGEVTWVLHSDGTFTAPGLRIEPGIDEADLQPTYKVMIDIKGFAGRRLRAESLDDAFAVCQHFAEACG